MTNSEQSSNIITLVIMGILCAFALVIAGGIAHFTDASFLSVFGGLLGITGVIVIGAFVWEYIVGKQDPHIYIIEREAAFLYSKGSQRVVFDAVTYFDNERGGLYINDLGISRYSALDNNIPYLAFDKDKRLVAVLPFQNWFSSGHKSVVLVRPDGSKERISIDKFVENQSKIMHEVKRKG